MSSSFIDPVKYGRLKERRSSKYIYEPDSYDQVIAPYDGIIDDIDVNKDDGFIRIKHDIDGEKFYSELRGVTKNISDMNVSFGKDVKKADVLAKASNTNIQFEILDKYKNKKEISSFFSLTPKKEEKKKEEKKKEEKKKEEKGGESYNKLKDDDSKGWNLNRKASELPSLFTTAFLSPLSFVNQIFSGKKKEMTEEETEEYEKLMEEIKRIKQLIK